MNEFFARLQDEMAKDTQGSDQWLDPRNGIKNNMSKCTISGCRNLQTACSDCGRVICTKIFLSPIEWTSLDEKYCNVIADQHYLITDGKIISMGQYVGCGLWSCPAFMGCPTHYMHLPELPKPPEII